MKNIIIVALTIILIILVGPKFQEKEFELSWLPIVLKTPYDWAIVEDVANVVNSAVLVSKDSENIIRIQRHDGDKVFTPDNFNNRNKEKRDLDFIDLLYNTQKSCWETNTQDLDVSDNRCLEPVILKDNYSLFKFQEGRQFVLVLDEDSFIHFSIEGDTKYLEKILDL